MGTEKRERQKANRQQRLIEQARAERTAKARRSIVRWSIAGVLLVSAVVVIAWIGGAFSGDDDTDAGSEPVLTAPVLTVPETTPPVTYAPGDSTPADETTGKPSVLVPLELPTELVITDIEEGTGEGAENGDVVEVNYVGVRSADGVEFDNSYDRGATFPVTLGAGGVIAGWDQGLVGVKEGGVRQLDIPADLAYGDADRGTIRPGDALSFVVEVVSITPAADS